LKRCFKDAESLLYLTNDQELVEKDVVNGRQTFKAVDISAKADLALIKAPTGKKHYTREEFRKEVDKMMDEMQRNNGGQGTRFRVSN
jgi:hypothetical protein